MGSVLDEILLKVQGDLDARRANLSFEDLQAKVENTPLPKNIMPTFQGRDVCVIAEIKRRSPSRGDLAPIAEPAVLASMYEAGGAHAISVLTEAHYFNGSIEDLRAVRKTVDVPVLRKDFIVSSYQLFESRLIGADLVLLIVAALEQQALECLIERSYSLGLTPIVEVHELSEVSRAVDAGAKVIGVNNRNLKTLEVNKNQFLELAEFIPSSVVKIAESGIRTAQDLRTYAAAGADAVLVGEALVISDDPGKLVHDLVTAGAHPSVKHH